MKPALTELTVELHVSDFNIVKDFYGKLGFEIVWERPAEESKGYLVMKRGGSILCFWPGTNFVTKQSYFKHFPADTKRGFGVELVIYVENIDEFYATVKEFCNVVEELVTKPWGIKDFRVEDPFGYYLRFSEPYNTLDPRFAVK